MTQIPPCVSLNNRKYITPKDKLNPRYFDYSSECTKKSVPKFNIGDKVLVLNLRAGPKWFEGTIVQVKGINVYDVHVHILDAIWKRHTNQLLPLLSSTVSDKRNDVTNQPLGAVNNPNIASNSFKSCLPLPLITSSSMQPSQCVNPTLVNIRTPPVHSNITDHPIPILRRSSRISKPVERYGIV